MKNILCFGDSNTWGYDMDTYDFALSDAKRMDIHTRWAGVLQDQLGNEYHVIEDGLNGRTVTVDDPYFPNRVGMRDFENALDAHAPLDLVVIQLGVNELKAHFGLSAGMVASGIGKMVTAAKKSLYDYPEPKILLVAPAPVRKNISELLFGFIFGDCYEKSLALGKLYRDIAEKNGCGFIDCADLNMTLNDIDGLHYCKADHAKLGLAVAEKAREMLADQ